MAHTIRHARDGVEIQVTDSEGVTLRVGVSDQSASPFAQACVGPPGPDSGVYLDREDAIAVRDFLTGLLDGRQS